MKAFCLCTSPAGQSLVSWISDSYPAALTPAVTEGSNYDVQFTRDTRIDHQVAPLGRKIPFLPQNPSTSYSPLLSRVNSIHVTTNWLQMASMLNALSIYHMALPMGEVANSFNDKIIKRTEQETDPQIWYIPIYCIVVRPKSQSKAHVSKKTNERCFLNRKKKVHNNNNNDETEQHGQLYFTHGHTWTHAHTHRKASRKWAAMDSSAQTTSSTEKQSDSTLRLDLLTLKNSLQDDTHHKYISFFFFVCFVFANIHIYNLYMIII